MQDQIAHYENKLKYEIDSWDLNEALRTRQDVVIIDARSSSEAYAAEHIPGAIHLPHKNMNKMTTALFSEDTLYISYCDGIGCNASTKGALNLARLGFTVRELIGGLDWWRRDGYPTEKGEARPHIGCAC